MYSGTGGTKRQVSRIDQRVGSTVFGPDKTNVHRLQVEVDRNRVYPEINEGPDFSGSRLGRSPRDDTTALPGETHTETRDTPIAESSGRGVSVLPTVVVGSGVTRSSRWGRLCRESGSEASPRLTGSDPVPRLLPQRGFPPLRLPVFVFLCERSLN